MKNLKITPSKHSVAFLFTLFMLVGTLNANAQDKHTVSSGETLFGISRTYNVTIDNVKEWNDLSGNSLSIAQVLIVSNPDDSEAFSGAPTSPSSGIHTVEPGETLFRISQEYGVSVNEIRQWNNLRNDNLKVGQQLSINESADPVGDAPVAENPGNDESLQSRASQSHHKVARGETLYRISQQHGMSLAELQQLNNISGSQLEIGQVLVVNSSGPASSGARSTPAAVIAEPDASLPLGAFDIHTLGENETVDGLISRHRMDKEEFISLNPRLRIENIRAGDSLKILKQGSARKKNPYKVSSNHEAGGEVTVTVYDPQQKGSTTTSGNLYNPGHLTAAHSSLRLGKIVYIENPANGKGVFVQINDRVTGNFLKLSSAAFTSLGFDGSDELAAKIYEEMPE